MSREKKGRHAAAPIGIAGILSRSEGALRNAIKESEQKAEIASPSDVVRRRLGAE
jgi:hypothetical protein